MPPEAAARHSALKASALFFTACAPSSGCDIYPLSFQGELFQVAHIPGDGVGQIGKFRKTGRPPDASRQCRKLSQARP
jgi:hypothetical protein